MQSGLPQNTEPNNFFFLSWLANGMLHHSLYYLSILQDFFLSLNVWYCKFIVWVKLKSNHVVSCVGAKQHGDYWWLRRRFGGRGHIWVQQTWFSGTCGYLPRETGCWGWCWSHYQNFCAILDSSWWEHHKWMIWARHYSPMAGLLFYIQKLKLHRKHLMEDGLEVEWLELNFMIKKNLMLMIYLDDDIVSYNLL